jgi:hypothetical protein
VFCVGSVSAGVGGGAAFAGGGFGAGGLFSVFARGDAAFVVVFFHSESRVACGE